VPACLAGVPVFVGGIGERLEPAPPLPAAPIVLVNPCRPLPTPAVFKAFAAGPQGGSFSRPARWADAVVDASALARMLADRRNDLTEAARGDAPEIDVAIAALRARPGCLLARLSGSGATCFGLFESREAAAQAAGAILARNAGWWVVATRLATGS
jgi:4-diphosphocytidyl-2-C-methyl-D-erythritol kinase